MAGLVPAIHDAAPARQKDVDARLEAGHDGPGYRPVHAAVVSFALIT